MFSNPFMLAMLFYVVAILNNRMRADATQGSGRWLSLLAATCGFGFAGLMLTSGFLGCPAGTVSVLSKYGELVGMAGALCSVLVY